MDEITRLIRDAREKHKLCIDEDDPNIHDLVRYAMHVAFNNGYKEGTKVNHRQHMAQMS